MPYQERQAFDDEDHLDTGDDAAPRGSPKFVLAVVLITAAAAGLATWFALMHSP